VRYALLTVVGLVIVGEPMNRRRGSPSEAVYVVFGPKLCIISYMSMIVSTPMSPSCGGALDVKLGVGVAVRVPVAVAMMWLKYISHDSQQSPGG
jgi:hypothetical protein